MGFYPAVAERQLRLRKQASKAAHDRSIEGRSVLAAIKDPEQLAQAKSAGVPLAIDGFKKEDLSSGAIYDILKAQLDEQCLRLQKLTKLFIQNPSRRATKRAEIKDFQSNYLRAGAFACSKRHRFFVPCSKAQRCKWIRRVIKPSRAHSYTIQGSLLLPYARWRLSCADGQSCG